MDRWLSLLLASVFGVVGDLNPMEFDYPTTLDYFLPIPIQKCVAFIYFSVNFGEE